MTTHTKAQQDKQKMSEIDEGITKIFDIKKRLGKGAYGIVWKALDKRTNETIAIKKIFDAFRDETDAQRTFREIIFLKAFRSHPNIVKLHNIYTATNNLDIYLIFEYMESDLHNIIKRGTILKDIHKRYVMYQLINAIKYIHSGNVIHRDLKPSNILIDSKCRCKLADFGLARSVAKRSSNSNINNDIGIDKPTELLLTDYVATRWYRAPEILVASKRYTKGIDMWSLGCILAEMIRGKPIFQGSSTINQIEKIVYTLPDITEHDIRSVGAGFGSVLLNKQILKDKKTTLNELLCGATEDALDLVKSLLVLDPMGRLTAHQALNHRYVEKFRNTISELELHVDVLPPFRDDIRLTVPEYRSKLYEIVQTHGEKNRSLDNNKNSINTIRNRDHKSQQNFHEKSEQKKITKTKQYPSNIVEDTTQQNNANLSSIVHRGGPKKTISLAKNKSTKSLSNTIGDCISSEQKYKIKDEQLQQPRSKSRLRHHSQFSRQNIGDQVCGSEINIKRFSTNEVDFSKQLVNNNNNEALKRNISKRLHRSAIALNKTENYINSKIQHHDQHAQPPSVAPSKNYIRHTKSEVIPLTNTPSTESSKAQERVCYEKRLKELEEEIERYKNEVKNFCRDTFRNTKRSNDKTPIDNNNNKNFNYKSTPKKQTATTSTPIKNIYFQLLSKGHHNDYHKSDLDLSGNSGNRSSSSDIFKNPFNTNSYSGRSKTLKNNHYNNLTNINQSNEPQLQDQQYHMTQKYQAQHRCRPLSKFA